MNKSLKQSMKEQLKVVAKKRNFTFEKVWHNLVVERYAIKNVIKLINNWLKANTSLYEAGES